MEAIKQYPDIIAIHPTGSRYICDPPVTNTDEDFIVLATDVNSLLGSLHADGWTGGETYRHQIPTGETSFVSARRGELNYIITEDEDFYDRFVTATMLAKNFNLKEKWQRIQAFHAVLDGEWLDEAVCRQAIVAKQERTPKRVWRTVTSQVSETAIQNAMEALGRFEANLRDAGVYSDIIAVDDMDRPIATTTSTSSRYMPSGPPRAVQNIPRPVPNPYIRPRSPMANQPGQTWREEF